MKRGDEMKKNGAAPVSKAGYEKPVVVSRQVQFMASTFSTEIFIPAYGPREAPRREKKE